MRAQRGPAAGRDDGYTVIRAVPAAAAASGSLMGLTAGSWCRQNDYNIHGFLSRLNVVYKVAVQVRRNRCPNAGWINQV